MENIERIPQLTRLTFEEASIDITKDGGVYNVSLGGQTYQVEIQDETDGRLELVVGGRRIVAYVSSEARGQWVTIGGRTYHLLRSAGPPRPGAAHSGPSELTAPMPGQVRAVNVSAGDLVTKGQVLVVLEAMKMEIRLNAPFDGTVISLEVRVGQTVEREQMIARLQPH